MKNQRPLGKGKDVDMKTFSVSANPQGCARALNNLSEAIEQAIRSAGHGYGFAPNSYTAEALSDAVALRSLVMLLAERVAAMAEGAQ
jgi:hypothetical protein